MYIHVPVHVVISYIFVTQKVIVTSQVGTQFSSSVSRGEPAIVTSLGISWTHCVDTRLFIEFYKDSNKRKVK